MSLVVQQSISRTSLTPPPQLSATDPTILRPGSAPIPNKHLAYCSPGPVPGPAQQTPTPPASPPTRHSGFQPCSLLRPDDTYQQVAENPAVYAIDACTLAVATNELASQHSPDPKQVFPWLHGLHAENQVQLAFFVARRKSLRKTPKCFRAITIVKVGGDLSRARLKGAISEDEILGAGNGEHFDFLEIDPRDGFSVRNFQIQATKMATVSDIVLYGDDAVDSEKVLNLAKTFATAQNTWRIRNDLGSEPTSRFNTFIISSNFEEFEIKYPEMVAIDSQGNATGKVMDFSQWERQEMCNMSRASEIAGNVWLGPTPDSLLSPQSEDDPPFDIFIEANDLAQPPEPSTLNRIEELSYESPQHLEFPSSGSIMPHDPMKSESDPLNTICHWIHKLASPDTVMSASDGEDELDGDIRMKNLTRPPRRILIHCTDGYTESTLLALAYSMYIEQIPVHEAWLRLHCEKKRNFFAYPSDVALLASLQPRLVPRTQLSLKPGFVKKDRPDWISRIDGSLPSRILPYMYLGNLGHANNPELLRAMGIKRILSVGEPANWTKAQVDGWGSGNRLFVDGVQDNGVDPLMKEFERCLEFIGRGRAEGTATLVHCRVGVSRSATICIAEVMSSLGLSFPRAYCYVRARRLNVIIQPHLRFVYELMKWDELCQERRGESVKRELEWATIAREIAAMNRPYASR